MSREGGEKGLSNQGSGVSVIMLLLQWEGAVWSRNMSLESIAFIIGREAEFQSLSFTERKGKKPWATTEKYVYSESTSTSAIELKN